MLTLNDGRKEMYQWDIGRIATIDVECDVVHFSNLKYGASLAVEVKNGEVAIPNKLLTSGEPIYCWAFVADENGNYTKQEQTLNVNKRAKPSDYVYTETETLTWKSLDERITELEKGGTGGSGVSIDDTLTISGAAADAKATGDQIRALSDEMLTEETDPTVPAWAKAAQKPSYTASEVGADPSGTAASQVSAHNTGDDTHSDIRLLIQGLTDRLNALADSDDTTLDQLSEIVAYIKSNKSLIDAITTNKVSVSDIVDNLTTNNANKPLSAAQGVALKALIDGITIPEALPNPNALTFTGAVTGSYDGSSPMTVNIPSGGGSGGTDISLGMTGATVGQIAKITAVDENGIPTSWEAIDVPSGGTGNSVKAKTQKLIDVTFEELTASLSVTLEHDFHKLYLVWSCGTNGVPKIVDSDGTAISSELEILIDTTSFSFNDRKIGRIPVGTNTWKTNAILIEYTDDLSTLLISNNFEISTGTNASLNNCFGGTRAMIGTIGLDALAPKAGRTINIVTSNGFFNATTRIILVGEYYE